MSADEVVAMARDGVDGVVMLDETLVIAKMGTGLGRIRNVRISPGPVDLQYIRDAVRKPDDQGRVH